MASTQQSVRKGYFKAGAALTTADISTATALGVLTEDSELPDPENVTDATMLGGAEVGATLNLNLRFLGAGSALSTLQTAKDANPPTELWFYFPNRSETNVTRYGPCIISQAHRVGNQKDPKRQSYRVRAGVIGDTSESIVVTVDGAVTLPA